MTRAIQLITSDGQVVEGQIVPVEQQHFEDVEEIWKPILRAANQPDAEWIWDYKLNQSQ